MARDFLGEQPGISVDGELIGAKWLTVDSSGFEGILEPGDDILQECLDKLDKFGKYLDGGRANEQYYGCRVVNAGGANG